MEKLTDKGRAWAEAHASESIVARVALGGDGWPAEFTATAIRTCNEEAAKDAAVA